MGKKREAIDNLDRKYGELIIKNDTVDYEMYESMGVKRGLRDQNGRGVITGITNISRIESSKEVDGKRIPCDGELYYRGYNIYDLVDDYKNNDRFGFEETAYLLLFGELPNKEQLEEYKELLAVSRKLPKNFVRDVIMKAPSEDIMGALTKSVLTLASYDKEASDTSLENVIRQSNILIALFPVISVYAYHAYSHYEKNKSLYIHRPAPDLSVAENILRLLRPDKKYSELEAKVLDIALILHMEHGGGNNSTFTTRVVTSAGSDTYSVIAAALSSLKGPKHGGANSKVVKMFADIKHNVEDVTDEAQVKEYLRKILRKEAFDKRGLIYGMGHAVYSISDPRAEIFKRFVEQLAVEKGKEKDFALYSMIEKLGPEVIAEERHIYKGVSANVDFYSGLVYGMMDIPTELYTPMFAIARIVGWSAHRMEELVNMDKIMRPAYESACEMRTYIDLEER